MTTIDPSLAAAVAELAEDKDFARSLAAKKQALRVGAVESHGTWRRLDGAFDFERLLPNYQASQIADASEWLRALCAALAEGDVAQARADAADAALADLIERLHRAEMELRRAATMHPTERARLMAKVSGVTLALSYAREAQRGRVVAG